MNNYSIYYILLLLPYLSVLLEFTVRQSSHMLLTAYERPLALPAQDHRGAPNSFISCRWEYTHYCGGIAHSPLPPCSMQCYLYTIYI